MSASAAVRRLERLARVPVALSESRQLAELTRPRLVELLADGGADGALEDVLAAAPGARHGPVSARGNGVRAGGELAPLGAGYGRDRRARSRAGGAARAGRHAAAAFGGEAAAGAHAPDGGGARLGGKAADGEHPAGGLGATFADVAADAGAAFAGVAADAGAASAGVAADAGAASAGVAADAGAAFAGEVAGAARAAGGAGRDHRARTEDGAAAGRARAVVSGRDRRLPGAARSDRVRAGARPGPSGAAPEPRSPAGALPALSALAAHGAATPVSRGASDSEPLTAEARTVIVRPEHSPASPPRSVADGPPRARSAPTSPPLPPPVPARSTTPAPAGSGLQDLVAWWDGEAAERERRTADAEEVTPHESFRGALEDVLLAEAHASGIEVRP